MRAKMYGFIRRVRRYVPWVAKEAFYLSAALPFVTYLHRQVTFLFKTPCLFLWILFRFIATAEVQALLFERISKGVSSLAVVELEAQKTWSVGRRFVVMFIAER